MEILSAVRAAIGKSMGQYEERWITGKELCEQFQCFTPSWLRTYGHLLDRQQVIVVDADGIEHRTGWVYPRNKIQEQMMAGSFIVKDSNNH